MKHLSSGLLIPFQCDQKRDFASADDDVALAINQVKQVLLTECTTPHGVGELPWRTDFGSSLHVLQHMPLGVAAEELARTCVEDAFVRWLPALTLLATHVERHGETLRVEVTFTVKGRHRKTVALLLGRGDAAQ